MLSKKLQVKERITEPFAADLTFDFKATLDFTRSDLLAHNNISQICYCGQISLQSVALQLTAVFLII